MRLATHAAEMLRPGRRSPLLGPLSRLRAPAAVALGAVAALHATDARAGGWLAKDGAAPIEQRVAIAVGPARTTVWTSLRMKAPAGPVGIVLPAAAGASIDASSDAWFEALSVATAPRVFPPDGASPYCPDESGPAHPFHLTDAIEHVPSMALGTLAILPDAPAVMAWAAEHGLEVPPASAAAWAGTTGVRFVVAAHVSTGGEVITPTLRVVSPGASALLPLALTSAGAEPLLVTSWIVGPGRARLAQTTEKGLDAASVAWMADDATSDWPSVRAGLLDDGVISVLEASSHEALSHNLPIASGTGSIDGVATTFFERASAYTELGAEVAACIAQASAALASSSPVSASCPRADYGVVDGDDGCVESPLPGETNPEGLRCGEAADDLAVALSGLVPSATWLTRISLAVPANALGTPYQVSFPGGYAVDPLITASTVDLAGCSETGSGQSSGDTTTTFDPDLGGGSRNDEGTSGGVAVYDGPTYVDGGCSCSGTEQYQDVEYPDDGDGEGDADDGDDGDDGDGDVEEVDTTSSSSDDCGGDTTEESSGDDCGGDTTESSGDDCGGDSSDGSSGDDCSGDSGGSDDCSGDSGSSSEGCSGGDGGGDSCSGGSGDDCSVASRTTARRARGPRLSPMVLGLLALVTPLRRKLRKKRAVGYQLSAVRQKRHRSALRPLARTFRGLLRGILRMSR